MTEVKDTFYELFDHEDTVQNYIKQTEANNDESINKAVNKIIEHMSGVFADDMAQVSSTTHQLLKTLMDNYLTEDFVRKYVQGSVQNQ